MILKICIFWLFHLWVFAIFRPVEYSTGPESAEYRPEMLQLPQGPSQKKWRQITPRYSRPTLKYVFQPQIGKIAYFMSSLFISCHSWFFVAEMLLMWKYEISAFRIWSQNVRIVFRSKVMPIWSSVEALLTTYFWKFHVCPCKVVWESFLTHNWVLIKFEMRLLKIITEKLLIPKKYFSSLQTNIE